MAKFWQDAHIIKKDDKYKCFDEAGLFLCYAATRTEARKKLSKYSHALEIQNKVQRGARYVGACRTKRNTLYRWIRAAIHGGHFHETCKGSK